MKRMLFSTAAILALGVMGMATSSAQGRGSGLVIYVASQGLFYDTIGLADLPPHGRFQQLYPGVGPAGAAATTEYGPGDPGYLGGRWWVDVNMNGEMDPTDAYFECPLLGPGRTEP